MRDIKFRARHNYLETWVYGSLLIEGEINYHIFEHGRSFLTYTGIYTGTDVDPKTVGQYTGLKDKNGKEIYHKDIGVDKEGNIGIIQWHDYGWFFGSHDNLHEEHIEIEIIGNIYENPELLN